MPSFLFYEGSTLNVYGNTPPGETDKVNEEKTDTSGNDNDKGDEKTPHSAEDGEDEGDGKVSPVLGDSEDLYQDEEGVWLIGSAKALRGFAEGVNNGTISGAIKAKLTADIDLAPEIEIAPVVDEIKAFNDEIALVADKIKVFNAEIASVVDKIKAVTDEIASVAYEIQAADDKFVPDVDKIKAVTDEIALVVNKINAVDDKFVDETKVVADKIKAFNDEIALVVNKINAVDEIMADVGKFWTPIVITDQEISITFDGDGHVIKGVLFYNENADNVGLFGCVQNATIQNLRVENSFIKGKNNVGGLIGHIGLNATVSNCKYSGIVNGKESVGGIIGGAAWEDVNIFSCSTDGVVKGDGCVAGIIGFGIKVSIHNSVNRSVISGNSGGIGGLFGYNGHWGASYTNVINSVNIGDVFGGDKITGNRFNGRSNFRLSIDNSYYKDSAIYKTHKGSGDYSADAVVDGLNGYINNNKKKDWLQWKNYEGNLVLVFSEGDSGLAGGNIYLDSELDIGEVGMIGDIIEPETRNPKAIFIWGAVLVLIVGAGGAIRYKIYKKRK